MKIEEFILNTKELLEIEEVKLYISQVWDVSWNNNSTFGPYSIRREIEGYATKDIFRNVFSKAERINPHRKAAELIFNTFDGDAFLLQQFILLVLELEVDENHRVINRPVPSSTLDKILEVLDSPLGDKITNAVMGTIIPGFGLLAKWEEWEENKKKNKN
ncbi:hypothetical protein [Priestia aryabhattai]